MKKFVLSILLVFFIAFALKAQSPQQPKPEDIQKNGKITLPAGSRTNYHCRR